MVSGSQCGKMSGYAHEKKGDKRTGEKLYVDSKVIEVVEEYKYLA